MASMKKKRSEENNGQLVTAGAMTNIKQPSENRNNQ